MSEYQVIARKWRPQSFGDVVGQQHVVRTLKNAISQNRTAHAYLFVGPRGVGKTTLARIFAKAMNCASPQNGEPCCQCDSCLAIAQDRSLDVLEVDAASRNSTNDMRELSEDVLTRPVGGKYKIYIIDEVHMLSKAAWNVLLKTVEEPPSHVKFIFATTEVHQVLPTIISRCQRFDLLPIPTKLIAERLRLVADTEKVQIRQDAIDAIARAAEGGMRDAQSLLDQMIAFFSKAEEEITGEQVLSLFGLTDRNDLDALLLALMENQPGNAVSIIARLSKRGKNLETLFDDLLNALRITQLCSILQNPAELLDEGEETIRHYQELSRRTMPSVLQTLLENLAPVGRVLHDALNKQVYLETILLKAMREAHAVTLDAIMARLNQLRTAGELKFLEQLPPVTAAMPSIQPATPSPEPAAAQPAPAVEIQAATIQETAPAVEETTPVEETAPIEETTQAVKETTPIEETTPVEEITPAVEETAPVEKAVQIETPVQEENEATPTEPEIEEFEQETEETVPLQVNSVTSTSPVTSGEEYSGEMDDFETEMETPVVSSPNLPDTLSAAEPSVAPRGDHPRESIINNDTAALKQISGDPD
ncbi:MAG: DNA polymerase III subunit gamma/tau, partial [Lentisphaeria bacterium]|nr:DNA polymerase III subunit gamma/tau [Lentisphaeria bacterium]